MENDVAAAAAFAGRSIAPFLDLLDAGLDNLCCGG